MLPGRLLQLVLGCAVHCDEKEEYIKKIMGLEEHVQTGVMQCIQVRNVENAHCDCFCLYSVLQLSKHTTVHLIIAINLKKSLYYDIFQELMEYEMPRNMGNMDYEKKLELSNNELESSQREVRK